MEVCVFESVRAYSKSVCTLMQAPSGSLDSCAEHNVYPLWPQRLHVLVGPVALGTRIPAQPSTSHMNCDTRAHRTALASCSSYAVCCAATLVRAVPHLRNEGAYPPAPSLTVTVLASCFRSNVLLAKLEAVLRSSDNAVLSDSQTSCTTDATRERVARLTCRRRRLRSPLGIVCSRWWWPL